MAEKSCGRPTYGPIVLRGQRAGGRRIGPQIEKMVLCSLATLKTMAARTATIHIYLRCGRNREGNWCIG